MERKATPASLATALASRVLPVPGGPTRSTPLGMRAPRAEYFSGSRRKSTISLSSSFSSSAPATERKPMLRSDSERVRIRAEPNFAMRSCPPPAICWGRRMKKYQNSPMQSTVMRVGARVASQFTE